MGKEIAKDSIHFDKATNRIVITLESGEEIQITPMDIREFLPYMTEEDKVKELFMMIHDIEKEKLVQHQCYIETIKKLNQGLSNARDQLLKGGLKMVDIKRLQVVIKSYCDEKNNLIELRRIVNMLEKQKQPLRSRLAELGHKLEEYEY